MYEIREYDTVNEEIGNLTHVWFDIKDFTECQGLILKRIFGSGTLVRYELRACGSHWQDGRSNMGLWQAARDPYNYELYNEVGPEMIKKYVIVEY